jgi:glutathionyl-hydroquinone reductase
MGVLIDGQWHTENLVSKTQDGSFKRKDSSLRNWITADGTPGPTGRGGFKAEANRYHLYVSHACPWAHRAVIIRSLKGLENIITLSSVHWFMGDQGWQFEQDDDDIVGDPVNSAAKLQDIYVKSDDQYTGRVTVPVLWDKKQNCIVSNESSEIIRMLNKAFDLVGANANDYYPQPLRPQIDAVNDRIYGAVNNGVYKCGFATTQDAYDTAIRPLFETLDWIEALLDQQKYLVGDQITEADWRLFTTLVRFDPVYVGHFKCNIRRISDYPNVGNYLKDLYQWDGVAQTVNMRHIKSHYYGSHESINPSRIVPAGPELNLNHTHNRDEKFPVV